MAKDIETHRKELYSLLDSPEHERFGGYAVTEQVTKNAKLVLEEIEKISPEMFLALDIADIGFTNRGTINLFWENPKDSNFGINIETWATRFIWLVKTIGGGYSGNAPFKIIGWREQLSQQVYSQWKEMNGNV